MRQPGNKELNEPVVSNFDDTVQERIHCTAESLANHMNLSIVVPVTLDAQDREPLRLAIVHAVWPGMNTKRRMLQGLLTFHMAPGETTHTHQGNRGNQAVS